MVDSNLKNLRTVAAMTTNELSKLHTGTLLKRLQALRSLHATYEASDWLPEEKDAVHAEALIAFKDTERWKTAVCDLKALLSEREHFPRGSKEKRQLQARQKRNR